MLEHLCNVLVEVTKSKCQSQYYQKLLDSNVWTAAHLSHITEICLEAAELREKAAAIH